MSDAQTPATPVCRYAIAGDAAAVADYHVRCWNTSYRGLIDDSIIDAMTVERTTAQWTRHFSADGLDTGVSNVVALFDDRPVGHLTVTARGRSASGGADDTDGADGADGAADPGEVLVLYVDPDHQGKGIGAELLTIGHRILRRHGCERAVLWTVVGNTPAIGFYERMGWRVDGTQRTVPWGANGATIDEVRLSIDLTDDTSHVTRNRSYWNDQADTYAVAGDRLWSGDPQWGIFGVPDTEVGLLPDVAGLDVVELGCGTGYVSAWCLRAGARSAVGLDNSPEQLRTAAQLSRQLGVRLPLVWADAERTPFADRSFDVAISEYGAAIWCDPYRWIPEAARLLRPGGTLVFLGNSVLSMLAVDDFEGQPATAALRRPLRGMHHVRWPDTDASEFHLSHGSMIRLLRTCGFDVLDLIELYVEPDADTDYDFLDAGWASKWPHEEAWIARRR